MITKPLADLTNSVQILLKIGIAVISIAVIADIFNAFSYATLDSYLDPNEDIIPSDIISGIIGLIQALLFIITSIFFLRWIHRVNSNLQTVSGKTMKFTPGWAVGWYFVPFMNLFKPFQAMEEIWITSHKDEASQNSMLGWWWTLWLASSVSGYWLFKYSMGVDDAEGQVKLSLMYVVSDLIDIALTVVALNMITKISEAYSKNFPES